MVYIRGGFDIAIDTDKHVQFGVCMSSLFQTLLDDFLFCIKLLPSWYTWLKKLTTVVDFRCFFSNTRDEHLITECLNIKTEAKEEVNLIK